MLSLYLYRIISVVWAIVIFALRKIKEDEYTNSATAQRFLQYSNAVTLKRIRQKTFGPEQILLLLPHCLQEYECPVKITSNIENCKRCGKCKISSIIDLKGASGIHVRVATGGTLARKYIKDIRPKLVIAVACERDLITGIIDSFPLPIYGIFNERPHGPCFNTSVDTGELNQVLKGILKNERNIKKIHHKT